MPTCRKCPAQIPKLDALRLSMLRPHILGYQPFNLSSFRGAAIARHF